MMRALRDGAATLELRWRLSLIIGALLTATLVLTAWVAVRAARESVQREVGASLNTAAASLDLTLNLLSERDPADMETALRLWSAGYASGRHLCVSLEYPAQSTEGCVISPDVPGVPAWFVHAAGPADVPVVRNVMAGPIALRLRLVSDPRDELREAWFDVRDLLLLMGLLAFSVNLCVFVVVSRALYPLRGLVAAMAQIGRDQPASALPRAGAPEVRVLAEGVQELGERLARSRVALRHLHLRNLELQEDERRMVASELHDEIGQHVAAIEMETIRVARMAPSDETERQGRLRQLRLSVTEIHRISRRLVHRLRPPAIESLGLYAALESLFERWCEEHPEPRLHVQLLGDCAGIGSERAVHLYRIVQESLSNVARHAAAHTVHVRLATDAGQVCVEVRDDGRGFDTGTHGRGFGLPGLRERVEALGGSLELDSIPGAGCCVRAVVPLRGNVARPPRRNPANRYPPSMEAAATGLQNSP